MPEARRRNAALPATRREWWAANLEANVGRDVRIWRHFMTLDGAPWLSGDVKSKILPLLLGGFGFSLGLPVRQRVQRSMVKDDKARRKAHYHETLE